MVLRLLQTGLLAGFLTAVAYSLVQAVTVTPLIFQAEAYEAAAGDHGNGAAPAGSAGHAHADNAAGASEWEPDDGFERYGFTFLANLVTAVGFAFVLAAAIAVRGRPVDVRAGLMWGLVGFGVFALAPSLGLPPEVPGNAAANVDVRQFWWIGTVVATALGLGLIVEAKMLWLRLAGIVPIVVPHLIGAPHPPGGIDPGPVPPELAALYVVWSLATTAFFWAVLGVAASVIYARTAPRAAANAAAS